MLLVILGWLYVVFGIIYLFNPEKFRDKLQKITHKRLRKWAFGIALVIGLMLIKATWGMPGLLAKILLVCGFIALIKAVYFLKGKAADKLFDWYLQRDLQTYRLWAVAMIVFGALILSV